MSNQTALIPYKRHNTPVFVTQEAERGKAAYAKRFVRGNSDIPQLKEFGFDDKETAQKVAKLATECMYDHPNHPTSRIIEGYIEDLSPLLGRITYVGADKALTRDFNIPNYATPLLEHIPNQIQVAIFDVSKEALQQIKEVCHDDPDCMHDRNVLAMTKAPY